jgi:membrane dipeptidase
VLLSIESGESIGCQISNIQKVYDLGARMLSLTWNDENAFASGCMATGGLKPDGIKAVDELNRLNMALDVSHINEQGFWEAVERYQHRPCASHSCAYDLCSVPRNLKRDQIDYIILRGGFIGINFYTEFLRGQRKAYIDDILNHIEYVLERGGEDTIGFGSDFCGIQYTPDGLNSAACFQRLPEAMERRGYPNSLIKKICYGNFARYVLEFLH